MTHTGHGGCSYPDGLDEDDLLYLDAVHETMQQWDIRSRESRAQILPRSQIPVAMWWGEDETHFLLNLLPAFTDVKVLWPARHPSVVLEWLAQLVGAARGRGDESGTPQAPTTGRHHLGDFELIGTGLMVRETDQLTGLESDTLYLVDRGGYFHVRRFCGTDHAYLTSEWAPPRSIDSDEVNSLTRDERTIHSSIHFTLFNLLLACAADPATCREQFGEGCAEFRNRSAADVLASVDQLLIIDPSRRVN